MLRTMVSLYSKQLHMCVCPDNWLKEAPTDIYNCTELLDKKGRKLIKTKDQLADNKSHGVKGTSNNNCNFHTAWLSLQGPGRVLHI